VKRYGLNFAGRGDRAKLQKGDSHETAAANQSDANRTDFEAIVSERVELIPV
jgi:hypothetical protein